MKQSTEKTALRVAGRDHSLLVAREMRVANSDTDDWFERPKWRPVAVESQAGRIHQLCAAVASCHASAILVSCATARTITSFPSIRTAWRCENASVSSTGDSTRSFPFRKMFLSALTSIRYSNRATGDPHHRPSPLQLRRQSPPHRLRRLLRAFVVPTRSRTTMEWEVENGGPSSARSLWMLKRQVQRSSVAKRCSSVEREQPCRRKPWMTIVAPSLRPLTRTAVAASPPPQDVLQWVAASNVDCTKTLCAAGRRTTSTTLSFLIVWRRRLVSSVFSTRKFRLPNGALSAKKTTPTKR